MIVAKSYSTEGVEKGTAELPVRQFGEKVNDHVMWLSVCTFLAHQRQGNASVKNRRVIRGGGRKPFRQKGTGQARQGTRRSPLMPGGARAFGPRPHKFEPKLPRKVRALGIRSALSLAARESRVLVVADPKLEKPRTSVIAGMLSKMGVDGVKCVLISGDYDRTVFLSGRNIPNLTITTVGGLNTYQLLNSERLIVTESALQKFREVNE
jgi:large subunit ribosomal protein L4